MLTVMLSVEHKGKRRAWTFVDEDVAYSLGATRLRMGSHGYPVLMDGTRRLLHRFVLNLQAGDGKVVDHINRRPLDNVRANLRVGTQALNVQNRPRSEFCGTVRCRERWQAHAKHEGKRIYLGTFETREEAAAVAAAYRQQHYKFAT